MEVDCLEYGHGRWWYAMHEDCREHIHYPRPCNLSGQRMEGFHRQSRFLTALRQPRVLSTSNRLRELLDATTRRYLAVDRMRGEGVIDPFEWIGIQSRRNLAVDRMSGVYGVIDPFEWTGHQPLWATFSGQ